MKRAKLTTIATALLILSGCSAEEIDSEYIQTDALWAKMSVDSDGERSRVVAELNVAGQHGTNVNLSPDDRLQVSAAGQTKTLLRDTDYMDVDYQEYLNVTTDDTQFTIALKRKFNVDARQSTVRLPKNFDIHGPLHNDVFTLNQNLAIDWDGLGNNAEIDLKLASYCTSTNGSDIIQFEYFTITDDGQHDVLLANLDMFHDTEVDYHKDCKLDITLTRKQSGQVDSRFQSGSKITASQFRKVKGIVIDN